MKTRKILALAVAPLFAFGMTACDVDQTEEGQAPDVEVEGGQVPEYDVDAADVDVGADTTTIETPDINVEDADAEGDLETVE